MVLLRLILLFGVLSNSAISQRYNGRRYDDEELSPRGECEAITTPLCTEMQYNMTVYPNILGHRSQEDAALEVHQFLPLVHLNCSEDLPLFLCSVYVPVCTDLKEAIPPCKHLCKTVRNGCEKVMNEFIFSWPSELNCDHLPEKAKGELCFSSDNADLSSTENPFAGLF